MRRVYIIFLIAVSISSYLILYAEAYRMISEQDLNSPHIGDKCVELSPSDKDKHSEDVLRLVSYVEDVSSQFGIREDIVYVVHNYSLMFVNRDGEEWRWIVNPEFMDFIMLSIINVESGGNPEAVGDNGRAYGLTQIWLSTARQYDRNVSPDVLRTIHGNLFYSYVHFSNLLKRFRGNVFLALRAWGHGSGRVMRDISTYGGGMTSTSYQKRIYESMY